MSEGPEVKITADKISKALCNKIKIENMIHNKIDDKIKNKLIDSHIEYVKTFGKNIILKFSTNIYLRNHMMMWGKWRVYDRYDYDNGLAKPPSLSRSHRKNVNNEDNMAVKIPKDVRVDKRTRLQDSREIRRTEFC